MCSDLPLTLITKFNDIKEVFQVSNRTVLLGCSSTWLCVLNTNCCEKTFRVYLYWFSLWADKMTTLRLGYRRKVVILIVLRKVSNFWHNACETYTSKRLRIASYQDRISLLYNQMICTSTLWKNQTKMTIKYGSSDDESAVVGIP